MVAVIAPRVRALCESCDVSPEERSPGTRACRVAGRRGEKRRLREPGAGATCPEGVNRRERGCCAVCVAVRNLGVHVHVQLLQRVLNFLGPPRAPAPRGAPGAGYALRVPGC